MNKRLSSRDLFELRNAIPVNMLIKDALQIPSKISEGYFRFLCPICNAQFYNRGRQQQIQTLTLPGAFGVKEILTPLILS